MRRTSFALALALAAGCSDGGSPMGPMGPGPGPGDEVTWHEDVAPIVYGHCVSCHSPGSVAPFSLRDSVSASAHARLMLDAVSTGFMPPWSADSTDDCAPSRPWQHDPRLSEDEIDVLRAWVAAGTPEGDPGAAAPLPDVTPDHLSDATHQLVAGAAYRTDGLEDEFICFTIDPGLDRAGWITGIEFQPDNLEVVHHIVLFTDPHRQTTALADENGQFDCFGGTLATIMDTQGLGVWVPGANPMDHPDIGIPLAPGTLLVMQMHYHPAGRDQDPDRSGVDLRITHAQPERQLLFTGIGNAFQAPELLPGPHDRTVPEFRVPADVAGHTEEMRFPIPPSDDPTRYPIYAIFPHMHYVGVDLELRIERAAPVGEPRDECLFKTTRWDFDWQRIYTYDTPIAELPTVAQGDVLSIRCEYDNTMENPFVRRALEDSDEEAPIDVYLGEETLDEMCVAGVLVLY